MNLTGSLQNLSLPLATALIVLGTRELINYDGIYEQVKQSSKTLANTEKESTREKNFKNDIEWAINGPGKTWLAARGIKPSFYQGATEAKIIENQREIMGLGYSEAIQRDFVPLSYLRNIAELEIWYSATNKEALKTIVNKHPNRYVFLRGLDLSKPALGIQIAQREKDQFQRLLGLGKLEKDLASLKEDWQLSIGKQLAIPYH